MPATQRLSSVDRAVRLLEILAGSGHGLTLEELSEATALPKSSTHRLLSTLRDHGFALQWEPNGRYSLGPHFLALASGFLGQIDLRALAHPLLVRLSREFDETVHMAVLVDADVVYLDKIDSSHALRLTSSIGGRNPAHATALGKALLAYAYPGDEEIAAWAEQYAPLAQRTKNTLTRPKRLAGTLAEIRRQGYAVESEESELGVRCVAKPLWFGEPVPRAAVSVSAPAERFSDARMKELIPVFIRLVEEALPPNGAGA